jgi:hypothetical protein
MQPTATFGAGLYVDGEYPFQALHPRHGREWLVGCFRFGLTSWHDVLAVFTVWGENAVETGEVEPGPWRQGSESSDEVEWIEDDMGGAVMKRAA